MSSEKKGTPSFSALIVNAQKHLSAHDPILERLVATYGDCQITPHNDYYAELLDSIISQQLSTKAAGTIHKRVLDLFDGDVPTPIQLLSIDDQSIRECGVSYYKISYLKDLATRVVDGRLDLDHISSLPNNEVISQLIAVKGIGEWSAHMFMIFSLGRLNVLPVGDLGIRKAAMKLYGLKELPKPIDLQMLCKKHHWHPYESVASWYLWRSLENT